MYSVARYVSMYYHAIPAGVRKMHSQRRRRRRRRRR
jgi:hypothetical protein